MAKKFFPIFPINMARIGTSTMSIRSPTPVLIMPAYRLKIGWERFNLSNGRNVLRLMPGMNNRAV